MIIGMRYFPRRVNGIAHFVIREGPVECAAIPLVQWLIGLQTVDKVWVGTSTVSVSQDE